MIATPRHSRAGLYAPLIILVIAVAAWSGWWFYLSRQVETRLDTSVARMEAAGWKVDQASRSIGGWPFRVRLAATDLVVTAPSGHAVAGPELVAETAAWNPDRWVLLAPEGLTVTRAGKGPLDIRADLIRASISGLRQRYQNIAVELIRPVFTPRAGAEPFPIASAAKVEVYSRPHLASAATNATGGQVAPAGDAADVLFRLIEARGRPGGPVEGMSQNGVLTVELESVVERAGRLSGADAAGMFSAWTRAGGRFVEVKGEMKAGESRATFASPVLRADRNGRLQGDIVLNAVRPLPALAGLAGTRSATVGTMGAAAATAASGRDNIDLTLVFRDGRTFLGPFALAPAPKLF